MVPPHMVPPHMVPPRKAPPRKAPPGDALVRSGRDLVGVGGEVGGCPTMQLHGATTSRPKVAGGEGCRQAKLCTLVVGTATLAQQTLGPKCRHSLTHGGGTTKVCLSAGRPQTNKEQQHMGCWQRGIRQSFVCSCEH